MYNLKIRDLAVTVRQRANDMDKLNYTDAEIVKCLDSASKYLSAMLIKRRDPEMIVSEDVIDYQAVPEGFHSFVGQFPCRREGPVLRTLTGDAPVRVRYWCLKGGVSSMNDVFPFPEDYSDAAVEIALTILLNSDEYDVAFEAKFADRLMSLLPGVTS